MLTVLALLAFTGNSLICRIALTQTRIDAASFTVIRLIAGAVALWVLVRMRSGGRSGRGSWLSAVALFGYAAGFSFAYASLTAATGALLLFGAVQVSMIGWGLRCGERLDGLQSAGLALACAGLAGLTVPGVSAPSFAGAILMLCSGTAWGIYSLRGKGAGDPLHVTSGNFQRAVPIAAILSLATLDAASLDRAGVLYAITSGALTSGVGYAIWYTALPALRATTAATVQLSVPVIAGLGGVLLLGEPVTARALAASASILGGIALVTLRKQTP
jgi:drug/metabolite transporter (DMT)-like permease